MGSHTKISDSDLRGGASVTEEDVQVLEVPMDDIKVVDVMDASGDLREYMKSVRLW